MKNVFVHSSPGGQWKVIDKSTGEEIDTINDVMLFNAEYKRYKTTRGWHGILSEEINKNVITLLEHSNKWLKLTCKTTPYYPRHLNVVVKKAQAIMLKGTEVLGFCLNSVMADFVVKDYCRQWNSEDFLDEDEEEDPWEFMNDEDTDEEDSWAQRILRT